MTAPSSISKAYLASSSVKPLGRMVWKSAPTGKIVPFMPGPWTSPPRTGMTRRTPWPVSPATIGLPTWMARLKTYFVASAGAMGRPSLMRHHALRQPGREQRKGDQDQQPDEVGRHERNNALEDGGKGHVVDHAFYHKYVHADRRVDQAQFHRHHDDDPEPDRVEAEMGDHGKD